MSVLMLSAVSLLSGFGAQMRRSKIKGKIQIGVGS